MIGKAPGQFNQVAGIAVDRSGKLYVLDAQNERIEELTASGSFIAQRPEPSFDTYFPVHMLPLPDGRLAAVDPSGALLIYPAHSGMPTRYPLEANGQLLGPAQTLLSGLSWLPDGRLLATDSRGNRLLVFSLNAGHGSAGGLGAFSTPPPSAFDRGAVTVFKMPASRSRVKSVPPTPHPATSASALPMIATTNLHVDPNSQAVGLKAGEVYLIAHLSVRNNAAAPINFALDELRMHSHATNQEYAAALDPNILNTQLLPATIDPGVRLDGDVAFTVPVTDSHAADYSVVFRPSK